MLLLELTAAVALCVAVHLGAMAFIARTCGITVRCVSYGVGPTLYAGRVLQIKMFPLMGHVRLKDVGADQLEPHESSGAFDCQAVWKQVFVPLVGPASL